MDKLTLAQINDAVIAAFQTTLALPQPQRVAAQPIGTNATLRTDCYSGPKGTGFAVVATVDLGWRTLAIVKQHGPESWRELPLNRNALLAELSSSYAKTCAEGVTVNGAKWKATDAALNSFTALAALLREKEAALSEADQITFDASPVTLTDLLDMPHNLTVLEFRAFIVAYGDAVLALWNTFAQQRAALAGN